MTKTFKQSKTNDKFKGIFNFEFDEGKSKVDIPAKIHLVPIGQWEHDLYGPIIITAADIREFIQNFNAGVRKGVFITAGHEGFQELPAVAWITSVEQRDTGLWGDVEWNESGRKALSEKEFKYFSPEMCRDYEDPEDHQYYRNVLTGGALTKSPYFKELEAIVFSDKNITSKFKEKQTMLKTLEEILALDITVLTDEDKAVLKENVDKLTEEQKTAYTAVIDAPGDEAETEEEKIAREAKETEDANIAAGLNADGTPKEEPVVVPPTNEEIAASEKGKAVTITASEYAALKDKADKGVEAFAKLEKAELTASVNGLVFSEGNKAGRFLPKSMATLTAFMEKLNSAQRASFAELMKEVPANAMFNELGSGDDAIVTSQAELDKKVEAKLTANPKMKYSDALKAVLSENKGLEERYDGELKPVSKK